jgi:hypothetical protein
MSNILTCREWKHSVEKVRGRGSCYLDMKELISAGKSDGQVIMIKNNDMVEAYQVSCICYLAISADIR